MSVLKILIMQKERSHVINEKKDQKEGQADGAKPNKCTGIHTEAEVK